MQISSALISGIAAIFLHETAHVAAAGVLRVKIHRVGINWRGPYVKRESGTALRNLAITLTGPGANLALALLFHHVSPDFGFCNFIMGVTNLLPLPSSDGARALCLLLNMGAAVAKPQSPHSDRLTIPAHKCVSGEAEETWAPAEELGSKAA